MKKMVIFYRKCSYYWIENVYTQRFYSFYFKFIDNNRCFSFTYTCVYMGRWAIQLKTRIDKKRSQLNDRLFFTLAHSVCLSWLNRIDSIQLKRIQRIKSIKIFFFNLTKVSDREYKIQCWLSEITWSMMIKSPLKLSVTVLCFYCCCLMWQSQRRKIIAHIQPICVYSVQYVCTLCYIKQCINIWILNINSDLNCVCV